MEGAPYPTDWSADTIFGKIVRKEIPAKIEYEDDICIGFHDIAAQAPVHILIIPKRRIPMLAMAEDTDENLLGHLLLAARNIAKNLSLENGFRIVINNGPDGGQSVYHLHVHLLAGRRLGWPPG